MCGWSTHKEIFLIDSLGLRDLSSSIPAFLLWLSPQSQLLKSKSWWTQKSKCLEEVKKNLSLCLWFMSCWNSRWLFTKNYLSNKKRVISHVYKFVDSTISRVDGPVKDISSMSKDIQQLKASLHYTLTWMTWMPTRRKAWRKSEL